VKGRARTACHMARPHMPGRTGPVLVLASAAARGGLFRSPARARPPNPLLSLFVHSINPTGFLAQSFLPLEHQYAPARPLSGNHLVLDRALQLRQSFNRAPGGTTKTRVRIPRISATQSTGMLPRNPWECCHPVHRISATQSTGSCHPRSVATLERMISLGSLLWSRAVASAAPCFAALPPGQQMRSQSMT